MGIVECAGTSACFLLVGGLVGSRPEPMVHQDGALSAQIAHSKRSVLPNRCIEFVRARIPL